MAIDQTIIDKTIRDLQDKYVILIEQTDEIRMVQNSLTNTQDQTIYDNMIILAKRILSK